MAPAAQPCSPCRLASLQDFYRPMWPANNPSLGCVASPAMLPAAPAAAAQGSVAANPLISSLFTLILPAFMQARHRTCLLSCPTCTFLKLRHRCKHAVPPTLRRRRGRAAGAVDPPAPPLQLGNSRCSSGQLGCAGLCQQLLLLHQQAEAQHSAQPNRRSSSGQ